MGKGRNNMHESKNIGFIGGGMVAEAIIRGLILHGHDASKLYVSDPSEDRRNILSILNKKLNVHENNQKVSDQADVLIICVKPQIFTEAIQSFTTEVNDKMIVSVAAGIEIDSMVSLFGDASKICRVMPNTPCLVGRGVSALVQTNLSESEIVLATYIFNSVGKTIWVQNEEWMHAITAVSGSGPAYFFHMMDLLKSAAMKSGIPEEIAETLSIQTAIGSSQLALNSADDLLTLMKKVMSPGGTTEAAFKSLDANDLDRIWDEAINAARERSIELGKSK